MKVESITFLSDLKDIKDIFDDNMDVDHLEIENHFFRYSLKSISFFESLQLQYIRAHHLALQLYPRYHQKYP